MLNSEISAIIATQAPLVVYDAKGKSYGNKLSNAYLDELGLSEELKEVAGYLGIDYEATGYTFDTNYTREDVDGVVSYKKWVNMPCVLRVDGVACIKWGKVSKPLSEVTNRTGFTKDDFMKLVCGDSGDEYLAMLPVLVADKNLQASVLNKLKKAGEFDKIAELLRATTQRTHPTKVAKNVPLRVYSISEPDQYQKYALEVEGHGIVMSNTRVKKQYEAMQKDWERKPELQQYPIFIKFGKDYSTNDGKPCVEVELYQDIPVRTASVGAFLDA